MMPPGAAPTIVLIATEESGDRLGANLMAALRERLGGAVSFVGVGGRAMADEGLSSLFPIEELSIIGFAAIAGRLPLILRRIRETVDLVLATSPDILIVIDSPDFTHRVARRVRARNASIPIVNYVSPTVWAWRPGRAKAMRGYVDHVLALFPFEADAHRALGGPPCTYVGHPLIEHLDSFRPNPEERARREASPPVLLALPGSRRSEIRYHMAVFGETFRGLQQLGISFELVLPTTHHMLQAVREGVASWPVQPRIVTADADKRAAFRVARAALAKSGTVTLELALAGVPMITIYKGTAIETFVARLLVRSTSVILANLVMGENLVPEFIQEAANPGALIPALRDVLEETEARQRQIDGFNRLDAIMSTGDQTPSQRAADIVLATMRRSS